MSHQLTDHSAPIRVTAVPPTRETRRAWVRAVLVVVLFALTGAGLGVWWEHLWQPSQGTVVRHEWFVVDGDFRYDLEGTTRLSASKPAVQQIPERKDQDVAKRVKSVLVPREKPWLGDPEDWDPRKHGWVAKCDVSGAEAVIRAACFARDPVAAEYLRAGKDIHGKTACFFYGVPEGTHRKGSPERDIEGKQSFFLLIFGGKPGALRATYWEKARVRKSYAECKRQHGKFFQLYKGVWAQYELDAQLPFSRGYIEDPYGRRWAMPPGPGVTGSRKSDEGHWMVPLGPGGSPLDDQSPGARRHAYVEHCYANRPTQSAQASTTLWSHALLYHGEYVELRTAPYWDDKGGLLFPEAEGWALHEGPGPGGKPFRAWINNTVHDAVWGDGAPGYLEPFAKLVTRRFNGTPADFLLDADQPWRVEIQCGPDFGHLWDYNAVAKKFGLEPLPKR
ncbi:MAG: hypothetical protein KKE65_03005 [Actinobacteria bacterium]|nr:hypothetical protein [Actinomycetota bacterium]